MTLDEAIKHCEEVAEEQERQADFNSYRFQTKHIEVYERQYKKCLKCASEHRQLAEWLRELKELRRNRVGRVSVGCANCVHMKTEDTKRPCDRCCNNYFSKFEEVKADADSDLDTRPKIQVDS